jgi:mannobiose 2-epimerase
MLERILIENILPFWYPRLIDSEEGGYRLHHDFQGKWKGRVAKSLVSQARTLWFFSMIAGTRYGKDEHLEAARHGYRFLSERLWDKKFGGFYWEVDPSGERVIKPHKNVYGQAFGLYALSQYGAVSGDGAALALAKNLFDILQDYAHDEAHGGYWEFCLETWDPAPEDMIGYRGFAPGIKSMNTHLHLMEAMTGYYLVTAKPAAQKQLVELLLIMSNAVVRKTLGACTDAHRADWTPLRGPVNDRVSFGHDIENIWMLIEACKALGISHGPFLDLYRNLLKYILRYGLDRKRGGFYTSGLFNSRADKREKIWWVQAEALLGLLHMYRITMDDVYWGCFRRTLNWIATHQVDWLHGEWHARVEKERKPSGDKAGEWKCPYHTGRAVLQCVEILESLAE